MAKIGTVLFQAVSIFFSFKIGFQNKFYFVILRNQYLFLQQFSFIKKNWLFLYFTITNASLWEILFIPSYCCFSFSEVWIPANLSKLFSRNWLLPRKKWLLRTKPRALFSPSNPMWNGLWTAHNPGVQFHLHQENLVRIKSQFRSQQTNQPRLVRLCW